MLKEAVVMAAVYLKRRSCRGRDQGRFFLSLCIFTGLVGSEVIGRTIIAVPQLFVANIYAANGIVAVDPIRLTL